MTQRTKVRIQIRIKTDCEIPFRILPSWANYWDYFLMQFPCYKDILLYLTYKISVRNETFEQTRQIWGIWKLRPAYSPETPNLGQSRWFLYRVTLKFNGWPCKTIGHPSFAVLSFVQHFIAIGEFKLELQSGNDQFGSNSTIFRAVWPWNLMYDLERQ